MKKSFLIIFLLACFSYLQGCLNVETKEYSFKIKKDGSGSGKIRYINIMSDNKDSINIIEQDYRELIDTYLNGNKPEQDYPKIKNVRKKLFEEDDQLTGELTFDFDNLKDIKFYKYGNNGPWGYYLPGGKMDFGMNESYFSSNGQWGGENMPVIFWDGNETNFEFKTTGKTPDAATISLIESWKKNDGK